MRELFAPSMQACLTYHPYPLPACRLHHFEDLAAWEAAGYPPSLTSEFLQLQKSVLDHPNAVADVSKPTSRPTPVVVPVTAVLWP